jgi:hypothetical protein
MTAVRKNSVMDIWTCNVVGTEVDGSSIVPLVGRLYSAEAPGFQSENHEILTVVDLVARAVKKRGLGD